MSATGLPARIAYACIALLLGGGVGFYSCMSFLPEFTTTYPQLDAGMDGSGIFKIAISVGAALALTASLIALTLPWSRHRKRRGRAWRISFSCVVVVFAAVLFADQRFGLIYDFAFIVWLTYFLTFTFVRYGVLDQARRSAVPVAN